MAPESFAGTVHVIPPEVQAEMNGVSWRPVPACPLFAELALLRLSHWDMDGRVRRGALIVAAPLAGEVVSIFARIFAAGFPIAQMRRIDAFAGDDGASMAANNCSGFMFRTISGTDRLSQHALGTAIDINPVQNPWVRGERVVPEAGRAYVDRDNVRPGMIVEPGPVVDAFAAHGWDWGGRWEDSKDYHHFAKHPR